MSAYTLQRQLAPAREAAQTLSNQIAEIRRGFLESKAADGGGAAAMPVNFANDNLREAQRRISSAISAASSVQGAIDGYEGLPTGDQLRELDWAWQEAGEAVAMLNRVIREDMPPVYRAVESSSKWPEVRPVEAPVRK
jgi:hypothetical protein